MREAVLQMPRLQQLAGGGLPTVAPALFAGGGLPTVAPALFAGGGLPTAAAALFHGVPYGAGLATQIAQQVSLTARGVPMSGTYEDNAYAYDWNADTRVLVIVRGPGAGRIVPSGTSAYNAILALLKKSYPVSTEAAAAIHAGTAVLSKKDKDAARTTKPASSPAPSVATWQPSAPSLPPESTVPPSTSPDGAAPGLLDSIPPWAPPVAIGVVAVGVLVIYFLRSNP